MTEYQPPFARGRVVDGPALIGAEWWQQGVDSAADPIARRRALLTLGAIVGGTAAVGLGVAAVVAAASSSDETAEARDALETQRDYGWSFGAEGEALAFDGAATAPFDRAAIGALAAQGLPPAQARLRPFYQATLFEALRATPAKSTPGAEPARPLLDTITPLFTPAMDEAYGRGRALAALFEGRPSDAALFVDLPGPEAVAFAAGAAGRFDPVFAFDNWPHPRGVVPAHLTLAALLYYQPLLSARAAARGGRADPPAFVLDRNRLRDYTDEAAQFDNRYVARVPGADQLKGLGVSHVLYVGPAGSPELDDLNEDFVSYGNAGVDVKALAPGDFGPALAPTPAPAPVRGGAAGALPGDAGGASYYYGGSPATQDWFWYYYPWYPAPRPPLAPAPRVSEGHLYRPSERPTLFRGVGFVGMQKAKPGGFGRVPVMTSRSSGAVYPRFGRSGSWGRSGGWSSGS